MRQTLRQTKLSKHYNNYITNTTTVEPQHLKFKDTEHDQLWNTVWVFIALFSKYETYLFYILILSFYIIILSYKEIILSFEEIKLSFKEMRLSG